MDLLLAERDEMNAICEESGDHCGLVSVAVPAVSFLGGPPSAGTQPQRNVLVSRLSSTVDAA